MNIQLYCPKPKNELNLNLLAECEQIDWIDRIGKPSDRPFLIIDEGHLGLADPSWPKILPVFVDFQSAASTHRRLHGGGAGQAVAKAVGLNKKRDLSVWDGTAGLARDSFVLASLGAQVTLFERNPVVYLLLKNGFDNLSLTGDSELMVIHQRLQLYSGSFLEHPQTDTAPPDVIYLDPMFPERQKSAKVKKDMALFHDIVGADEDADSLLAPALDLATFRVVVKRPKQAPPLAGRKPSTELVGKSNRFDIYTKRAIA